MARKVFISFRFNDGNYYKKELCNLFDSSTEVINCSEDEDRSMMSEETIKKYLYNKLKGTSVTIVLLTPNALNHHKNYWGEYDDWMYDEIRYSLEDRDNNRTNGLVAVYTPEAKAAIISKSIHSCPVCNETKEVRSLAAIDNLARRNMLNIKDVYKKNPCDNLYDDEWDSYCSLVSWDEFKRNYAEIIDTAAQKRDLLGHYDIRKRMK